MYKKRNTLYAICILEIINVPILSSNAKSFKFKETCALLIKFEVVPKLKSKSYPIVAI